MATTSMQELMARMKAQKAAEKVVASNSQPSSGEVKTALMDRLDTVTDKPIHVDYIGESIESSPKTLNHADIMLIKNRVVKLQEAMEKDIPEYASILHTIHKALSKDDELTHMMDEDEVGILLRAMKLRKNVVLVEEKSKKSAKKSLKDTTLDDIL